MSGAAPALVVAADDPRYRACVGLMLIDRRGLVFVGRRSDGTGEAWQMPQGGIDKGETPEEAAMRELAEEAGVRRAAVLGATARWYAYDLPPEIALRLWRSRYRGQRQKWFALRFLGEDGDIDLGGARGEFSDWRWVAADRLVDLVVPFKRAVYTAVLDELGRFARPAAAAAR